MYLKFCWWFASMRVWLEGHLTAPRKIALRLDHLQAMPAQVFNFIYNRNRLRRRYRKA
jgi:hypothetical protein